MKVSRYFVLAAILLAFAVVELPTFLLVAEESDEPTRMHFVATNSRNEDDWK